MLSAAVYSSKGLLMKEADQTMSVSNLLHKLHCKLVVVSCNIGSGEYRCHFMLGRSHFVVFCLGQDSMLPEFFIEILHEGSYPWLDGTEVVVFHFLSFWSCCSEEGAACKDQVLSLLVHFLVYKEVFLFRSYAGLYALDLLVSEEAENTECGPVDGLHASEKRSLLV